MHADRAVADELLELAREVQRQAHVPYSHFPVGAALRTAAGRVFTGANVENAAYPEGMCAEAAAIAAMASAGERVIDTIVTICDGEALSTPCGGCRQKLAEFGQLEVVVTLATTDGRTTKTTIGALLPGGFSAAHMEKA